MLLAGVGALIAAAQDPVIELPRVRIIGYAPLVKVGEFRMKQHRIGAAAVTDGRYIYIIGGMDDKGNVLGTIERFDPQAGSSEEFAKLKHARLWHGAVLRDGKILVLGGRIVALREDPPSPSVIAIDPRTPGAAHAAAKSMLYEQDPTPSMEHLALDNSVEIIDLKTRQVVEGINMPDERKEFGCVILGDDLYVIGGQRIHHGRITWTNTVEVFSFSTARWREGLPMPTPRSSTGAAVVTGPFVMVPGGYDGSLALDKVEAYNPRENKWIILPPLHRDSSAQATIFFGHYVFLFGNYEAPEELIAYDLFTKKSESFTLQYTPARHTAAVVLDGKIYVIGGKPYKYSSALDCIQVFAPPPKTSAP